ncbi:MAG: AAA family ATPase [Chloroflexi bacterium]|nr:AAA family ATPase [Chloroflexota bacterium]
MATMTADSRVAVRRLWKQFLSSTTRKRHCLTMGSPPQAIHVFLLGRFEVARGGRVLRDSDWTRRKAAALFQRIALERRLTKDQAIEFLWSDADAASGANNLYRTLHALRQTLDTALGAHTANAALTFEDGIFTLGDSVWVDAREFQRLAHLQPFGGVYTERSRSAQGRLPTSHLPLPTSELQSALDLYTGDLLPDELYAEWTQVPRDALRRLFRETALTLVAHYREARDYARAIALLSRLVMRDRADEAAHRELMRAYALAGRRHDALRQYQIAREALAAELDAPPEPETAALYTQILNGELGAGSPPVSLPPAPIPIQIEDDIPIVARAREIETLRAQLDAARRGQGQTVLLAGDAGVGKTRLAFETLRIGAAAGMTTLIGAVYEQEGQMPYQPFIEAFDRYLAEQQRPAGENPITHFRRTGSGDPQQDHWALFKSVAAFLTSIRAPTILLIDDLHAADEATLRLFHYLARHTRAAPALLLAAYRPDAVVPARPFATLLNTLYRERLSQTITLLALPTDAVAPVLEPILGGQVDAELAAAVHEMTEGNPFFIREIARALLKGNQLEKDDGQWHLRRGDPRGRPTEGRPTEGRPMLPVPADLGGLVRERVARLGEGVEAALTAAAVIGREFDYETLRGVAVLPDPVVLDALDAALAGYLIEETESGYRFRHPLIRRALYDSLSRARRAHLHTRTAETVESISARRAAGVAPIVETLAHHYDLSDRRDRALDYLIQAGDKAAAIFAFEVAVGYFERALALMDALGLADHARRWKLLEKLGWWYNILADTPRAVARFEQAIALPPENGWQSPRRDRVRLHCGAAVALITAGHLDAVEAHLQTALQEVDEQEDAAEYSDLLYNVAQFRWHRGEYREAYDAAQSSLAVAERIAKPEAIARAFEMLALVCHSLGEWQTGIQYEQRRATLVGPALDVTDAFDTHL